MGPRLHGWGWEVVGSYSNDTLKLMTNSLGLLENRSALGKMIFC